MGNFAPKSMQLRNIYTEIRFLLAFKRNFQLLGILEDDLALICDIFRQIDVDSSFEITIDEFLIFINVEQTNFIFKIFNNFDLNQNVKIDLKEFIYLCWNYCTLNHERLCE